MAFAVGTAVGSPKLPFRGGHDVELGNHWSDHIMEIVERVHPGSMEVIDQRIS